jgi:hypothetical protein
MSGALVHEREGVLWVLVMLRVFLEAIGKEAVGFILPASLGHNPTAQVSAYDHGGMQMYRVLPFPFFKAEL